jgi:hypothetical protein
MMTTKVKKPAKKPVEKPVKEVITKTTPDFDFELVHKTISNLTDIVSALQNDVKRIKIRIGI